MSPTMAPAKMAACHPDRPEARKRDGLCIDCVVEAKRAMENQRREMAGEPQLRPIVDYRPQRIPGVRQNAVTRIPTQCHKCGNRFLMIDGRRISCPGVCGGCGADWFLVDE